MTSRSRRKVSSVFEKQTNDDDLEVQFINDYIGKGLFAKREFAGGELLTEYVGELISDEEAGRREDINPRRCDYMFSFKHDSKFWCIDAFCSSQKARFINDAEPKQANAFVRKQEIDGTPRLFVIAKKSILKGEEIRYDYGNKHAEWRLIEKNTEYGGNAQEHQNEETKVQEESEVTAVCSEQNCATFPKGQGGDYLSALKKCSFQEGLESFKTFFQNLGEEELRPAIEDCLTLFKDIVAQPPSSETEGRFSFVTTGLNKRQEDQVKMLAELTGNRVTQEVDFTSTTHVITSADLDKSCSKTLKFVMGVAARLWVMTFTWVEASLKMGKLLPEGPYEVHADDILGHHGGPKKSRTWKGEPLLEGYFFKILGHSPKITKGQMVQVLTLCGANVVSPEGSFPDTGTMIPVKIVLSDPTEYTDQNSLQEFEQKDNIPVVSYMWVINTVASFHVQPFSDYEFDCNNSQNSKESAIPACRLHEDSRLENCPQSNCEGFGISKNKETSSKEREDVDTGVLKDAISEIPEDADTEELPDSDNEGSKGFSNDEIQEGNGKASLGSGVKVKVVTNFKESVEQVFEYSEGGSDRDTSDVDTEDPKDPDFKIPKNGHLDELSESDDGGSSLFASDDEQNVDVQIRSTLNPDSEAQGNNSQNSKESAIPACRLHEDSRLENCPQSNCEGFGISKNKETSSKEREDVDTGVLKDAISEIPEDADTEELPDSDNEGSKGFSNDEIQEGNGKASLGSGVKVKVVTNFEESVEQVFEYSEGGSDRDTSDVDTEDPKDPDFKIPKNGHLDELSESDDGGSSLFASDDEQNVDVQIRSTLNPDSEAQGNSTNEESVEKVTKRVKDRKDVNAERLKDVDNQEATNGIYCRDDGLNVQGCTTDSTEETHEDRITEKDGENSDALFEPFVMNDKNKYSYCLYCSKPQQKLPRHCARHHADEALVAEAMAVPSGSIKEKRDRWLYIRNLGNHDHNNRVYTGKAKDLVVRKRPKVDSEKNCVYSYVACQYCFGYFCKETLWLHAKSCPKRMEKKVPATNHVREGRKLMLCRFEISAQLNELLNRMIHDDVLLIIRNDRDILKVGENTLNTSNSSRKGDKAREKMRLLAKVLSSARSLNAEIKSAKDLIHPSRFDEVVKATRCVSGFDEEKETHLSYSCALRIGYVISDLAVVVKSGYVKDQCRHRLTEVDDFLFLRQTEWNSKVTAAAYRQKQEASWKAPKLLPLTEDCVRFNSFLREREKAVKTEIANDGCLSVTTYKELASVTLAQIVVYNRRRPKEVESVTVKDYKEQTSKKLQTHDEVLQSLSTPEKISLTRMTLLTVRGKRGRGVPILLPKNLKESTDMLARHNKGRKYLFSRIGDRSLTPLRAYHIIAELADATDPPLKNPSTIRCTRLRKHLATLSQLLSLQENELEQLAHHMGHNIATHREYYRLPVETILLAKVSKLLCLAEAGRTHEFQGKSLSEVDVCPEESVLLNTSESGDENESTASDTDQSEEEYLPAKPQKVKCKLRNHTKGRKYNKWSKEQEDFLKDQKEIQILLKTHKVPRKSLCELIIQRSNNLLQDKTWLHVKNKIHNTVKARRK